MFLPINCMLAAKEMEFLAMTEFLLDTFLQDFLLLAQIYILKNFTCLFHLILTITP